MSKTNCLMAINVFNLNDEEFNKKLYESIVEEDGFVLYSNYGYNISKLYLIDLIKQKEIRVDDILEDEWKGITLNKDNYLLFNIEWTDNILKDWIDEGDIDDLFLNKNALSIKEYIIQASTKNSSFDIKNGLFEAVLNPSKDVYLVLCFEYCTHRSYEGEWDSWIEYKGIVDMNNINLIKE